MRKIICPNCSKRMGRSIRRRVVFSDDKTPYCRTCKYDLSAEHEQVLEAKRARSD